MRTQRLTLGARSRLAATGARHLRCARKALWVVVGPIGNPLGGIMVEERGKENRPIG
jgi:hypothetical protein